MNNDNNKSQIKFKVNLKSVNYKLALYSKIIGLYTFASIILISMCIYVCYVLINLYRKWVGRKKRLASYVKEKIQQNDASSFNTKTINAGNKNDYEIYENGEKKADGNKSGEGGDEYYKFDDNINSIISSYKTATNAKKDCKKGGEDVGAEESKNVEPERSFIDPSYDNYK